MSLPPPLPASLPAGGEDHRLHPWSWLFVLLMQLRHYFLPLVALLVFGQRGDRDPMWAQLIPLTAIAAVVGHHSASTTKRFYDNVKVPPMIKIPIQLEHPEDPVWQPVRTAALRLVESA